MFPIKVEHLPEEAGQRVTPTYSPNILPMMQSLLKTLADIDFQFRRDLETIENGTIDEPLKHRAIANLTERHRERRAPYLLEISRLEEQMKRTLT